MDAKALATYLQDHEAAAYAGIDLFDQVDARHARADIRAAVARFGVHARADVDALHEVMNLVGVRRSLRKQVVARYWQVGREVVDGARHGSRPEERDAIDEQAVTARLREREQLWATIAKLDDARLETVPLTQLRDAARADREEFEDLGAY